MKAVLQYRASPGFAAALRASAPEWLTTVVVDEADRERFAVEMRDAEVLLHVLEPVTREVIEAAPALGLVQKIGVGVNTIDRVAAAEHGVAVANMPGSNSAAVAEHALALMFAVLRRLAYFDRVTRAGTGWQPDLDVVDSVGEIGRRTVGLVGYGGIPRRLAPVLVALGARVLYTARSEKPDAAGEYRSLDDLIAQSDVVSLHLPLTPQTERILDARRFANMRDGAVLINTARGGLVDEEALIEALTSGRLRGAGLDVFASEPIPPDHPLLALDRVVLTPHVAWLTPETLERSLAIAIENCRRLRDGEPLLHEVPPEDDR